MVDAKPLYTGIKYRVQYERQRRKVRRYNRLCLFWSYFYVKNRTGVKKKHVHRFTRDRKILLWIIRSRQHTQRRELNQSMKIRLWKLRDINSFSELFNRQTSSFYISLLTEFLLCFVTPALNCKTFKYRQLSQQDTDSPGYSSSGLLLSRTRRLGLPSVGLDPPATVILRPVAVNVQGPGLSHTAFTPWRRVYVRGPKDRVRILEYRLLKFP